MKQMVPNDSSEWTPLGGSINSSARTHMKKPWRAVVGLVTLLVTGCGDSGFSNCVQVQKESDFTGRWLAASQTLQKRTVRTEECVALDQAHDNDNGPKLGTVRWAECLPGPDCGEAGEF